MRISPRFPSPRENRLLAALPPADYERLLSALQPVTWALGEVVYEPGVFLDSLYFPLDGIVSLLTLMADGATVETGMVGNDGPVGIALLLSGHATPHRAVVQVAGHAVRMPGQRAQEAFQRGGPFQRLLLRYTQALLTQIAQTAACNKLHPLDQRLCRWLLWVCERVKKDEVKLTQEFIAGMLGVWREGVTLAVHDLEAAGLIRCARGRITILNRQALEARACECYRVVKAEFNRLLGPI